MAGIKSVRLAIQVATLRRDQAAAILLQMQQSQSLAQEQMSQLKTYADETEARWARAAQISVTTEMMRHHYQFMDRLHQAVILQEGVLGQWGSKVQSSGHGGPAVNFHSQYNRLRLWLNLAYILVSSLTHIKYDITVNLGNS